MSLINIPDEALERAKNMTKINVIQSLERSQSRIEDNLRSLLI